MVDLKELDKKTNDALSKETSENLIEFINSQRVNDVKELEEEFEGKGEVKGHTFTQLKKSDKGYIYQVKNNENGIIHYEVFHRRENTHYNNITYPKSNVFGKYAWTFLSLEAAEHKFNKF